METHLLLFGITIALVVLYGAFRVIYFFHLLLRWQKKKKAYIGALSERGVVNPTLFEYLDNLLFDVKDIFSLFKWHEKDFIDDALICHTVNKNWEKVEKERRTIEFNERIEEI